ncbi:tetratricopeptide repeat protein [bacterium]|nr:tetratricopeptide repeat protein [bacterium]QQR56802.1 MAG: tetratricopeptide repeat protein [Candidatus Melainabacteria bacterium]
MFKFPLSPIKPVRAYFTLAIAAMVLGFFVWKPIYRDVSNEVVLLYCSKFKSQPNVSEPVSSSYVWLQEAIHDLKSGKHSDKSAKLQKLLGVKQDKLLIDAYLNYPNVFATFGSQTMVQVDGTMLDLARPNMPEMKMIFQFSFKKDGGFSKLQDVEILTLGQDNKFSNFTSKLSRTGPKDVIARNKQTIKHARYSLAWSHLNRLRSHEEFNRAIESNPKCSYLYYFDGTTFLQEGKYKSALSRLNKCLQLDPYNSCALVNRSDIKYKLGDFAGSVFDTNAALTISPGNAFAHMSKGFDHYTYYNYDESIRSYTKAIQLNPLFFDSYLNRAMSYEKANKHSSALLDYEQAIKLRPNEIQAYMRKGLLLSSLGRHREAIVDLKKALALCPQNGEHQSDLMEIYNELSNSSFQQHLDDEAFYFAELQIKLDPKNLKGYCNRAFSYWKWKQYKKAIADFERAIVLNPEYSSPYLNLAKVKKCDKDLKGALAACEECLKRSTVVPELHPEALKFKDEIKRELSEGNRY